MMGVGRRGAATLLLLLVLGATGAVAECHRKHSFDPLVHPSLEPRAYERSAAAALPDAARRRAQTDLDTCQKDLDAMAQEVDSHGYVRMWMMSRCPFAARALQLLIPVLLPQQGSRAATTLRLEFIGVGTAEDSFRSLHGPGEVRGDRLYLCMQELLDARTFMLAVFCLSQQPERVGELQAAEVCFKQAHMSQPEMQDIFDCSNDGSAQSEAMLRNSFTVAGNLKIGESPTIYWGVESHWRAESNATEATVAARLQSIGAQPGTELLYCGDRLDQRIGPPSLLQANCDAIATFRRGAPLGANLHLGETECPMDSPNAEPECIDGRVDGGSTMASVSAAFVFAMVLGVLLVCCMSLKQGRNSYSRDSSTPLREASRQGLSTEQMAALPRMRVADGRGSTCTVCFEPVDDGEEIFALRCGHRHHQSCLTDWLTRKSECPDCRGPIRLEEAVSDPPSVGSAVVAVQPATQEQEQPNAVDAVENPVRNNGADSV